MCHFNTALVCRPVLLLFLQDSNNNLAFKMASSAVSLSEKRVLKNAQGQPVCSLKKKVGIKMDSGQTIFKMLLQAQSSCHGCSSSSSSTALLLLPVPETKTFAMTMHLPPLDLHQVAYILLLYGTASALL